MISLRHTAARPIGAAVIASMAAPAFAAGATLTTASGAWESA